MVGNQIKMGSPAARLDTSSYLLNVDLTWDFSSLTSGGKKIDTKNFTTWKARCADNGW